LINQFSQEFIIVSAVQSPIPLWMFYQLHVYSVEWQGDCEINGKNVSQIRHGHPKICLEGRKIITKCLSQDRWMSRDEIQTRALLYMKWKHWPLYSDVWYFCAPVSVQIKDLSN